MLGGFQPGAGGSLKFGDAVGAEVGQRRAGVNESFSGREMECEPCKLNLSYIRPLKYSVNQNVGNVGGKFGMVNDLNSKRRRIFDGPTYN